MRLSTAHHKSVGITRVRVRTNHKTVVRKGRPVGNVQASVVAVDVIKNIGVIGVHTAQGAEHNTTWQGHLAIQAQGSQGGSEVSVALSDGYGQEKLASLHHKWQVLCAQKDCGSVTCVPFCIGLRP